MAVTEPIPRTADEAIQAFAAASDGPPVAALQWALDHWEQAAPRFLQILDAYTDGSDATDVTVDAVFFIVHLFGDRGDQRAYRAICRLMLDEERLITALGDTAAVETLKGVLIKCFSGDAVPLQQVIEATRADSITRGEALLALAWVARDGQYPEKAFREYLDHLLATMQPREADYVWYAWVVVAAVLGYGDLLDASKKLIADGWVPEEWLTLEELPDLVATGDAVGKNGLLAEEVEPFDDVIGSLEDWPWPEDGEDWEEPAQEPYINPLRHVGRNDPCPCGSGKKFKNCHLVAE